MQLLPYMLLTVSYSYLLSGFIELVVTRFRHRGLATRPEPDVATASDEPAARFGDKKKVR